MAHSQHTNLNLTQSSYTYGQVIHHHLHISPVLIDPSALKMHLSISEPKRADTLCQRCLRLTFDNSAIVDAPPPQRYEGRDDLDLDEYGIVHLDFTLEDELPDLPGLERSGCHMCLFLKKVILTQLQLLPTGQSYVGRIALQFTEFHPDLGTVQFTDSRDDWLPNRIAGELRMGTEVYPIDVFAKHRADGELFA